MRKLSFSAALVLAVATAEADQLLPSAEGTTWEYESTETLTGSAPVQSVVTVRSGKDLLDGKEVVKLETLSGNTVSKIELVSADENGIVCLARSGKDGKIAKLNPPQPIIAAPLKVGSTWLLESEVAGINVHPHCTVVAEENLTVAAGKFRTFHLQCKDSSLMSITLDRWFVPGTGFVKEATEVRGPGMLQRTTLELTKISEVLSKPAPANPPAEQHPVESKPSSSPKPADVVSSPAAPVELARVEERPPTPPKKLTAEVSSDPTGGLKTKFRSDVPNIYVRWQGHDLPEGAKIRVTWVAEDVGDLVEPDFIIDETETVASATDASARFTLGRPPDGWAEGKYRLEFYVDDLPVETIRVTIDK